MNRNDDLNLSSSSISSSSSSSEPRDKDGDRVDERDGGREIVRPLRLSGLSGGVAAGPGEMDRFVPRLGDARKGSLSMPELDTVVAIVDAERCENRARLSAWVVAVRLDDLLAVDFVLLLLIEPANNSVGMRDITSRPNLDAIDFAVGVDGRELLLVLNSNKPY